LLLQKEKTTKAYRFLSQCHANTRNRRNFSRALNYIRSVYPGSLYAPYDSAAKDLSCSKPF